MRTIQYMLIFFCLSTNVLYSDHLFDKMESLTFNPVGSGARALSMGAFIGIADDATAASWNPGRLINLKRPEISFVADVSLWRENNTIEQNTFAEFTSRMSENNLNYFSLTTPLEIMDRNIVVSMNYQHLYNFKRDQLMRFSEIVKNDALDQVSQDGKLSAIGFALCFQLRPDLSFGITLNFWKDWLSTNGWEQTIRTRRPILMEPIQFMTDSSIFHKYDFSGFNMNIGISWDMTDQFTCGFVLKTPFTADLKHTTVFTQFLPNYSQSPQNVYSEKLDMPLSCGVGVAYRFSDNWSLSADLYMTDWSNFILTDPNGEHYSFISGEKEELSNVQATYQIRFGSEYLIINKRKETIIPIRAGIFYDPMPSDGSPDNFYGFSMGTGISTGPYVFDIAYQYRLGVNVGESKLKRFGFSQDVQEFRGYGSFIFHF